MSSSILYYTAPTRSGRAGGGWRCAVCQATLPTAEAALACAERDHLRKGLRCAGDLRGGGRCTRSATAIVNGQGACYQHK